MQAMIASPVDITRDVSFSASVPVDADDSHGSSTSPGTVLNSEFHSDDGLVIGADSSSLTENLAEVVAAAADMGASTVDVNEGIL